MYKFLTWLVPVPAAHCWMRITKQQILNFPEKIILNRNSLELESQVDFMNELHSPSMCEYTRQVQY